MVLKPRRASFPFLLALVLLVLGRALAVAEERILDFASEIEVAPDASMTVRETIRVVSAGERIRRGIYRDFPTRYEDALGNDVRVEFALLETRRDGEPETSRIERLSNGVRVYLGRENVEIPAGEHVYEIVYRTDRQLGFFADHDELYWNVTGNGWEFAIEHASARVRLPRGVRASGIRVEGYTGAQGSTARDLVSRVDDDGRARFETTRPLGPLEGLTIVVSWPKGFVREPTRDERIAWFLEDNRGVLVGLAGLAILLVYFGIVWHRVGRDPEGGPIVVAYEPPHGFSPAAMRYLVRMGYDERTFVAALLDLAVRGAITIDETGAVPKLRRAKGGVRGMPVEERQILASLFTFGPDREEIELRAKNHAAIRAAVTGHQSALGAALEKIHFLTNGKYVIPGIVITAATLVAVAISRGAAAPGIFMMVWLTGWSFGVWMLGGQVVRAWRAVLGGRGLARVGNLLVALFTTAFALPFFGGELFGLWTLSQIVSPAAVVVLLVLLGVNVLFHELLKAPTAAGRQVLDRIEGFRRFLAAVEGDRLERIEPTLALFEKYLPHAVALDVEDRWAARFAGVLDAAKQAGRSTIGWYSGAAFAAGGAGAIAGAIASSMSSAVAASSSAPGSGSGGGGGGSSGGGGGGGGGGGW